MSAVRVAQSESSREVLSGFDVALTQTSSRRVKLRRSLHRGALLGVTIFVREHGRLSRIEQFDIATGLQVMERSMVESLVLDAYEALGSEATFEAGLVRLRKLHEEGFCVACNFAPVHSSAD